MNHTPPSIKTLNDDVEAEQAMIDWVLSDMDAQLKASPNVTDTIVKARIQQEMDRLYGPQKAS